MRQEPRKSVINIRIDGKPVAKQRPRFTSKGRVYDKQSEEKRSARVKAMQQMRKNNVLKRAVGSLDVEMTFHTPIPTSWSQKRREREIGEFNPKKPDLDNYVKFYCDILNGLLYDDDNQVVRLFCEKRYSDEPRTEIKISEL